MQFTVVCILVLCAISVVCSWCCVQFSVVCSLVLCAISVVCNLVLLIAYGILHIVWCLLADVCCLLHTAYCQWPMAYICISPTAYVNIRNELHTDTNKYTSAFFRKWRIRTGFIIGCVLICCNSMLWRQENMFSKFRMNGVYIYIYINNYINIYIYIYIAYCPVPSA